MMEGVVSRYGKKLLQFEFERQNIAVCCKQTFCQFNIKLIQGKFFQFSQWPCSLVEWAKKSNFFTLLPDLDSFANT